MNAYLRHIFFDFIAVITFLPLGLQISHAQKLISHYSRIDEISVDSMGHIIILDSYDDLYYYNAIKFEKIDELSSGTKLIDNRNNNILCIDADTLYAINDGIPRILKALSKGVQSLTIDGRDTFVDYSNRFDAYLGIGEELCITPLHYPVYVNRGSYFIRDKIIVFDNLGHSEPCADISYRQALEFDITTTERYDNTRIVIGTSNQGVWMYGNDQYKKFYIPGLTMPNRVKSLNYRKPKLWIHTIDSLLYLYNENQQTIQKVDESVIDYDIDRWDCIYINKGNYIEINSNYRNQTLPKIAIHSVRCGYDIIDHTSPQNLSKKDNNLAIQLESIYSPAPDAVKYQYSLAENSKWKQLESDVLYLKNISSGNYLLQIRGTIDGVYYTKPIVMEFSIASDWRDSVWPIVFGVLSLLMLALFFSIRKMNKDKKKILDAKRRIDLELKKMKSDQKLGQAQMNPHFMFNALNSISGLISLNQNKQARKALNDLAQMMRMTLDNSSKESINIKDEIRFLEKYLSVEKAIRSDGFTYNIVSHINDQDIPPMIIQPFVENAIIHGISPLKDNQGIIEVLITEVDNYIKVKVKDNGVGRIHMSESKTYKSAAVDIVKSRLALLDKWGKEKSYVKYEDKHDINGKPSGTEVNLLIPTRRL